MGGGLVTQPVSDDQELVESNRKWAAVFGEFYDALKQASLPDAICHDIVVEYASWQWAPDD
jgi:hypothetical protein